MNKYRDDLFIKFIKVIKVNIKLILIIYIYKI